MTGLVKFGPGPAGMELRELPDPVPGSGEIRVKVEAAGICGSDIHIMKDEIPVKMPVVIGHEYVGIVDSTGPGVTGFKPGDWITSMTTYESCGKCRYCREGLVMFCAQRKGLGFHVNGTMAEYLLVPEANSFPVPAEIEDKIIVAACEPFGCAVRGAAERALIKPGDLAVVSGPGTLGLSVVQIAKLRGAYVIAFGLPQDQHRLKMALELGADEISSDAEELKKRIYSRNPDGADIAFEVAGANASMNMCIDIVRKRGTLAQMGLFPGQATINMNKILDNELTVTNNFGCHRSTWELSLKLLREKKVKIDGYVETRIPLSQWQEGFNIAASKGAFKVLLLPGK